LYFAVTFKLQLSAGRPPYEPGSSRRAGLTPSPAFLIEKLSPRLPGDSDPGVFERSGPGNDGGGHPCVSFLIKLAVAAKGGANNSTRETWP